MCLTHVSEKEMTRSCVVDQALGGGRQPVPRLRVLLERAPFPVLLTLNRMLF